MPEALFDFHNLEQSALCLQHEFAPNSICFGCGPANQRGLRLKSFVLNADLGRQLAGCLSHQTASSMLSSLVSHDRLVACFRPAVHHQAFHGNVNGGILGTLIDCQMNWTACWNLMQAHNQKNLPSCKLPSCKLPSCKLPSCKLPSCVTATYQVDFLAPSPSDGVLLLVAEIVELGERKASVRCELGPLNQAGDGLRQLTARGTGTFVAVKQDHPAHHRWTPN